MKRVWTLFSIEMWEKFNFYGMRAIFSLFMVHFLGLSEANAAIYYGAFLALSYLTPMVGGALADRYIGYHKSVIIGAILLSVAQILFFASASNIASFVTAILGAILVICGNGFFKPSITALLSIRTSKDTNIDAVFSTYYFFLNLGVLLGLFIVPFFGDKVVDGVRDLSAFKWGFLSAFIAMVFGLILYLIFTKDSKDEVKKSNESMKFNPKNAKVCFIIFVCLFCVISYFSSGLNLVKTFLYPAIYAFGISLASYVLMDKSLSKDERANIKTIFISAIFIVFFWATFEQAGSSLTFIANNQMDRSIFGYEMPASMIMMFNPLFVLILSIPFSVFYLKLEQKGIEPKNLNKQAFGLFIMGLSYLIIAYNVKNLGMNLLSIKWFILMYFLQTCAEMLISPIGFALVAKLAPKRLLGLIFGIFYLANAAGYALSGTLAALMPPTTDKFIKAKELGINLQEILDKTTEPTLQVIQTLKLNNIPFSYPEILGYEIRDLFSFFMIFFVLCCISGVLLFIISKLRDNEFKI
ncbi:dipeptide/tripeptide permease [Campylobacter blaseri]|uniref:MFS transporter n=1 Tax=Campylobacter blaseri TaxID=2042961 RepID=A0A2P8R3R0_9BACT|nr:peptide MFS transporter [Campylobacter blaseri]PSM53141.1 MFS transporter [Campylobacter blaseri]PSM54607.1 MFS transporter [Campylobacter blaseri]QKF86920.1 dipeptide/tripeptide permease [Campylobacter blaseri]